MSQPGELLTVQNLVVRAHLPQRSLTILDGVTTSVRTGQVVGLVGESGSGKTTLARATIGLLERNVEVAGGSIDLAGRTVRAPGVDETHRVRGSDIGMVFQDASRSLNPLFKVGNQLAEVLRRHEPGISRADVAARSAEVLEQMRITDSKRVLSSYPHQLSGGLRQRAAIAIAVVTRPRLVIADECTSALDVTTQTKVVSLFRSLVDELGIGLLFVTHDLMLASDLCDGIVVMNRGRIVEQGSIQQVLDTPQDAYTRRLLDAIPSWGEQQRTPA